MAYTPTNWKDGDIISAEKMNKLEQGVAEGGGGGVLLVNVTEGSDGGGSTPVVNSASLMRTPGSSSSSTFTVDKTYGEVDAAVKAGKMVYLVYNGVYIPLSKVNEESSTGLM